MTVKIITIFFFATVCLYTNAQNVGIGTTTPANKLSVNGNADFTGNVGIGTVLPGGELHVKSKDPSLFTNDQQQTIISGVYGFASNWQSFTAGISGWLSKIDVYVGSPTANSSEPGTIKIYSGQGIGGTLLSTTAVVFQNPFGLKSYTLSFFPNITAGNIYTVEFSTPSATLHWVGVNTNNPYAAGRADFDANWDYGFKTYVSSWVDGLIVTNGKVGLGTITPYAKLEVIGRIRVADGTQGMGKVLTSDPNGYASWVTPSGSIGNGTALGNTPFWDGTMWVPISNNIYNDGFQVGIGTTSPAAKLHVVGSLRVDGGLQIGDGNEGTGKVLTSDANGVATWQLPILPAGSQTGNTPFWDGTRWVPISNNIYNDGFQVGIGTTSPAAKLHVVGSVHIVNGGLRLVDNTQGAGKVLTSDANGYASWVTPGASSGWGLTGNAGTSFATNFIGTTDNRSLRFRTNNTEKMIIDSLGRVGIGTNNPTAMLHIKTGALVCDDAVQRFFVNGGYKWDIAGFAGSYEISRSGVAVDFYINGTNGNIGLGTTAPTAKLSVNGNANNTTGAWGVFSDARIKTVNNDFTDGLNVISKIHTVKFNYNANAPFKADGEQIGIIAQELEKVAPYMVSQKDYGDVKNLREVNNQAYVFLLINSVKELNTQNEQLKTELDLIKAKLGLNTQGNKQ